MRRVAVIERVIVGSALLAIVAWGIALRYVDPLRTHALGAEDPFTHVVFIKEWTQQGFFADAFHMGTEMYPPGMHAFTIALAAFSGIPVYTIARLMPPLFGGLAILGTYALAARLANPAAGVAGAALVAVMPEHIFRTELFFPTAFDLALVPAWLLAFHLALVPASREPEPAARHPKAALSEYDVLASPEDDRAEESQGSASWRPAIAPMLLHAWLSIVLALMHPWLVVLFVPALAIYATLVARRMDDASVVARAAPLLVLPVAFAMAFRWDVSDTGFADFMVLIPGLAPLAATSLRGVPLFGVLALGGALVAGAWVGVVYAVARVRAHRFVRLGARVVALVCLLALVSVLVRDLPKDVHYVNMLGILGVALSIAGFALAFLRPTALGEMGASIALVLFPLTAVNVFDSPYWPQRSVAFLTVGVCLLGAAVAAHAYEGITYLARNSRLRVAAAPAALLALALIVAGSAAATARPAPTWYRMYDEAEFAGFEHIAARLAAEPGARVFVHGWQPALMIKTFTDPGDVWYAPDIYDNEEKRSSKVARLEGPGYVLVEKHTRRAMEKQNTDLAFLDGPGFGLVYETPGGGVQLYGVVR